MKTLPTESAMQTALGYVTARAEQEERLGAKVSGASEGAEIYRDAARCIKFAIASLTLRDPPLERGRDQVAMTLRYYAKQPYADSSNETVRVRAVLLTTAADIIERGLDPDGKNSEK